MIESKEALVFAGDAVIEAVKSRRNFSSKPTDNSRPDLLSYKFFHLEKISLVDGVSIATRTLVEDPRFHLLRVRPEVLSSFFASSFFYALPHRYHNLDHLVNTLCFGDFILRVLEKRFALCIVDKMCLMIALCLHDIGHPGENNRKRIGELSGLYGCPERMSFELIHASICLRMVSRHRDELFKGLSEQKMNEKQDLIERMIFVTDLKLNKEIIDMFDSKYFERSEANPPGRRVRSEVSKEISEIELKMIVKIADLSSCYKDYGIFNRNSTAFWSEMYGEDDYDRTLEDISGDIWLLERISIPLADSFSRVFESTRFLYDQAIANLEKHRKYYDDIKAREEGGYSSDKEVC